MNYWIFKANPKEYNIEKHLAFNDRRVTWRIENYKEKIRAGDVAFIWRTGNNPRIIGIMNIESDPSRRNEFPHEIPFISPSGYSR